jgi:amidase
MARNVSDLAMLLSVQAGFDPRAPLSLDGDGSEFLQRLDGDLKGKRIAWASDFRGFVPCDPEVLDVCRTALKSFETLGAHVEEAIPDYSLEAVWQAQLTLRAWQSGGALLEHYRNPEKRALLKPEAVSEIEKGLNLSAYDVTAASLVRTEWTHAVSRFFARYDYLVAPTAQVFPFDIAMHWPEEIAGRKMQTYHEWMKGVFLITMSGCPALAAPAGFSKSGLPIGIQIVAPLRQDLACLKAGFAYEAATGWTKKRLPPLIAPA